MMCKFSRMGTTLRLNRYTAGGCSHCDVIHRNTKLFKDTELKKKHKYKVLRTVFLISTGFTASMSAW